MAHESLRLLFEVCQGFYRGFTFWVFTMLLKVLQVGGVAANVFNTGFWRALLEKSQFTTLMTQRKECSKNRLETC